MIYYILSHISRQTRTPRTPTWRPTRRRGRRWAVSGCWRVDTPRLLSSRRRPRRSRWRRWEMFEIVNTYLIAIISRRLNWLSFQRHRATWRWSRPTLLGVVAGGGVGDVDLDLGVLPGGNNVMLLLVVMLVLMSLLRNDLDDLMEDDSHPLSSRWALSYLFTWVEILLQRSNALLPRALLLLLLVALLLLLLRRNALPRIDRPHRVTKPIGTTTTHKLAPSRLQNSEPKPIKTTNTGFCYKLLQKNAPTKKSRC